MTRVLFVCMGNICRSPTAEGVFRRLVEERAPQLRLEIDSAGTHDYHVGEPPDERADRRRRAPRHRPAPAAGAPGCDGGFRALRPDRRDGSTEPRDAARRAARSLISRASGCSWSSPATATSRTCPTRITAGRSASSRCSISPRRPRPACSTKLCSSCSPGAVVNDGAGAQRSRLAARAFARRVAGRSGCPLRPRLDARGATTGAGAAATGAMSAGRRRFRRDRGAAAAGRGRARSRTSCGPGAPSSPQPRASPSLPADFGAPPASPGSRRRRRPPRRERRARSRSPSGRSVRSGRAPVVATGARIGVASPPARRPAALGCGCDGNRLSGAAVRVARLAPAAPVAAARCAAAAPGVAGCTLVLPLAAAGRRSPLAVTLAAAVALTLTLSSLALRLFGTPTALAPLVAARLLGPALPVATLRARFVPTASRCACSSRRAALVATCVATRLVAGARARVAVAVAATIAATIPTTIPATVPAALVARTCRLGTCGRRPPAPARACRPPASATAGRTRRRAAHTAARPRPEPRRPARPPVRAPAAGPGCSAPRSSRRAPAGAGAPSPRRRWPRGRSSAVPPSGG